MLNYLVYGYAGGMQLAKLKTETALQINFEKRDSSYLGDYFLYGSASQLLLEIKENIEKIDGEALEREFSQYPTLLYIAVAPAFVEILDRLPHEFFLLKKEAL